MADLADEETDNSSEADDRNFYKLEKWTRDRTKIDRLLYAGNNLDKGATCSRRPSKHPRASKPVGE
jgi:hypothetical protein